MSSYGHWKPSTSVFRRPHRGVLMHAAEHRVPRTLLLAGRTPERNSYPPFSAVLHDVADVFHPAQPFKAVSVVCRLERSVEEALV